MSATGRLHGRGMAGDPPRARRSGDRHRAGLAVRLPRPAARARRPPRPGSPPPSRSSPAWSSSTPSSPRRTGRGQPRRGVRSSGESFVETAVETAGRARQVIEARGPARSSRHSRPRPGHLRGGRPRRAASAARRSTRAGRRPCSSGAWPTRSGASTTSRRRSRGWATSRSTRDARLPAGDARQPAPVRVPRAGREPRSRRSARPPARRAGPTQPRYSSSWLAVAVGLPSAGRGSSPGPYAGTASPPRPHLEDRQRLAGLALERADAVRHPLRGILEAVRLVVAAGVGLDEPGRLDPHPLPVEQARDPFLAGLGPRVLAPAAGRRVVGRVRRRLLVGRDVALVVAEHHLVVGVRDQVVRHHRDLPAAAGRVDDVLRDRVPGGVAAQALDDLEALPDGRPEVARRPRPGRTGRCSTAGPGSRRASGRGRAGCGRSR